MIPQPNEDDVQRNARNVKKLTKWLSTDQKRVAKETTQQNHIPYYLRITRGDRSGLRVTRGNRLGVRLIRNGAVGMGMNEKEVPDYVAEAEFEKRSGNKLAIGETKTEPDMSKDYYFRLSDIMNIPSDHL